MSRGCSESSSKVTPSSHRPAWAFRRSIAPLNPLIHRSTTAPTASAPYVCHSSLHSAAPTPALPPRWPAAFFGPHLATVSTRGSSARTMPPRSIPNPSTLANADSSDLQLQLQQAIASKLGGAHPNNPEPGAATAAATGVVVPAVPLLPLVVRELPLAVAGRLVRRYKRFLADVQLGGGAEGHGSGAGRGAAVTGAAVEGHETAAGAGAGPGAGVVAVAGAAAEGPNATRATRAAAAAAAVAGAAAARGAGAAGAAVAAARAAADGHGADGGGSGGGGVGVVTVHCPNTGPMTGLLDWPLAPVLCSVSNAKGRKYAHTLEMIQACPGGAWVGVHSASANAMAGALLEAGALPQLGAWTGLQREVAFGGNGSRVDFVLTRPNGRRVFVEVKSVTLAEQYRPDRPAVNGATAVPAAAAAPAAPAHQRAAEPCLQQPQQQEGLQLEQHGEEARPEGSNCSAARQDAQAVGDGGPPGCSGAGGADPPEPGPAARPRLIALFPDTVSTRAQRHVSDLMEVALGGKDEAACVFVIQRADCELFAPCQDKDPEYARLVRQAAAAGVRMLALRMELSPPGPPPLQQPQLQAGVAATAGAGGCGSASVTASASVQQLPARVVYLGEAQLDLGYGGSSSGGGIADQSHGGGEGSSDGGRGVRGGRGSKKVAGSSKLGGRSAAGEGVGEGGGVGQGGGQGAGRRKRRGDAATQQQGPEQGQEGGTQKEVHEALRAGLEKRRRRGSGKTRQSAGLGEGMDEGAGAGA